MGEPVNFFWIGGKLGSLQAACIRSFQRHGHPAILHCFDPPEDVPGDVQLFDASKLMRRDEVIAYRREKSFALTGNIYRYRMLAAGMGLYADCDVFCLRPFPETDWLLGWETDYSINCAVLKAPAESALVRALVDATTSPYFVAPWWRKRKRRLYTAMKKIGIPFHVNRAEWGTTGPRLLTHLVKSHGLTDKVLPADIFYPLHFHMTDLLFQPGLGIGDLTTSRSRAIHLFNHTIIRRPTIPEGCPLAEILEAG